MTTHNAQPASATPARRALRPCHIDLIRDGVPPWKMKRDGRDVAVYNALLATAMAALNAGWTYPEWSYLLGKRGSRLGAQAATRRNGEDRPQAQVEKQLRTVWDRAAAKVAARTPFTEEQRDAYVAAVRTWLSDPSCPAPENVRRVMDAVARRCAALHVTSTACPRSYLLAETGLGLTALRTALATAERSGLLTVEQKGRRGTTARPATGIATVYRLPHAETLPQPHRAGATPAGHPGGTGTPATHTSAAVAASSAPQQCPPRASSAPPPTRKSQVNPPVSATPPTTEEDPVITVTVSGAHADELTARLAELLAGTGAQVSPAPKARHLTAVRDNAARSAARSGASSR